MNTTEIMNDARSKGIELDSLYLSLLAKHLISRNLIDGFALRTLCLSILEYMKENGQTENSKFIEYVKCSKALRGKNIDFALIQKEYDIEKKEWNELQERI